MTLDTTVSGAVNHRSTESPHRPDPSAADHERGPQQPWSRARLIGFRLLFVLVILCGIRFVGFINIFLQSDRLSEAVGTVINRVVSFHVLRLVSIGALFVGAGPGGQSNPQWIVAFFVGAAVVAGVVTVVWTVIDRRRTQYHVLYHWFRVYLRYAVAFGMLIYGAGKVLPAQFQFFRPSNLIRPMGEYTPQGLLWTFMAFSPGYTVFAGLVEFVGAVLLLFRRTVLIGALLIAAALGNVIAMDLGYAVDPSALLFAILLFLFNAAILAPYLPALTSALTFRRASTWADSAITSKSRRRLILAVKAVVIAGLVVLPLRAAVVRRRSFFGAGHEVYGVYEVIPSSPPGAGFALSTDTKAAWRRVASDGEPWLLVQTSNGDVHRYALRENPVTRHWMVMKTDSLALAELDYEPEAGNALTLHGTVGGDSVILHLKRVSDSTFRLFRRR